jgi:hypothetical protein
MLNKLRKISERVLFHFERWQAVKDPVAWRNKHPISPASDNPVVTFFTPIFEKQRAPDWNTVVQNLQTTVKAVRDQTNQNWRMIICSQDEPEGIDFDDQVVFLEYPTKHCGESDKLLKLRYISRFVARQYRDDGYAFFLDGDDIPHPDLVKFIVEDNNGQGYYVDQGYSADLTTGDVFEHVESDGRPKPFYLCCGSCNAVRFDCRKDRSHLLHVSLRGDHMSVIENMEKRVGLKLYPIPFATMIYSVNHGTSDQDLIGRRGNYAHTAGVRLMDDQHTRSILSEFKVVEKG